MFEQIVLPLDGSTAAEITFPYVAEIASRFGSRIILIRVCSSSDPLTINESRSYLKGAAGRMNNQLDELQARNETEVTFELRVGVPAVEIINYASQTVCDLVAIASRGESGDKRWPLGNVAAKVLRSSSFPTLLVRKRANEKALKERKLIKKILVPLDGSQIGEAAIPLASALAVKLQAELELLQVIEPSKYVPFSEGMVSLPSLHQYEEIANQIALEYLNKKRELLMSEDIDVSVVTATGSAADQIIDYSRTNDIDLIALPSHGRSGIGRWVFGSVTDKVLHAGDTPVMVIRSKPL